MSKRNYWKPHFVTKLVEHNGVSYYQTGIHEVHYENDVINGWTENTCDVTMTEDTIDESYEESVGLFKLYQSALTNIHYIEYTDEVTDTVKLKEYIKVR